MTTGVRRADWQPGDFLPGTVSGHHTGPMFKLKNDHECPTDGYCDQDWSGTYSAMRWSPAPLESDRP